MVTSPEDSYTALISRLRHGWPGQQVLHDFVNSPQCASESLAKFDVVTIGSSVSTESNIPAIEFKHFEGSQELARVCTGKVPDGHCRLFIVENICPRSVALLGGCFDIDPQFFADHLSNGPWYRIEGVMDHTPALPSSQKLHDFLQLRYIDTLAVERRSSEEPDIFTTNPNTGNGSSTSSRLSSDTTSFVYPDNTSTRIHRKAGKLMPRTRNGRDFKFLLCTRQVVSIWFDKNREGRGGWTGRDP
jgi:hypothetical protein